VEQLERMAANPFVTIKGAAERLGVAFTTAQRAVERLQALRIVQEVSEAKRDRVYCAKAILDILEEPAHLTPEQPG
jgi:ribosomal protein S25